jgi:hypothetical protein
VVQITTRATALRLASRTDRATTTTNALSRADLLDPVFTIEHIAALFHVSVDTACPRTRPEQFEA